jgi:hypothetical protein
MKGLGRCGTAIALLLVLGSDRKWKQDLQTDM